MIASSSEGKGKVPRPVNEPFKAFTWMLMAHLSHNFRVIFFRRAAKSSRTNRDAAKKKYIYMKIRKGEETTQSREKKASILNFT